LGTANSSMLVEVFLEIAEEEKKPMNMQCPMKPV
jgi:hypothetical protein